MHIKPERLYKIIECLGFSYEEVNPNYLRLHPSSFNLVPSPLVSGFMVLRLESELSNAFNRVILDASLECFKNDWSSLTIDQDHILLVGTKSHLIQKVISIMMGNDSPKSSLAPHCQLIFKRSGSDAELLLIVHGCTSKLLELEQHVGALIYALRQGARQPAAI